MIEFLDRAFSVQEEGGPGVYGPGAFFEFLKG
jgi:hypothetical protein